MSLPVIVMALVPFHTFLPLCRPRIGCWLPASGSQRGMSTCCFRRNALVSGFDILR